MVSVARQLTDAFRIKAERLLDAAGDPREVLDYAYTRQLDLLQQIRQALAEVAAGRKRGELQAARLRASEARFEEQAEQALAEGREDLARLALSRRAVAQSRIAELEAQQPLLAAEEDRLGADLRRMEARVEAFRTRKEALKAEYTRAEAEARIGQAVSGVGEEIGDIGTAVRRAQDRIEQARARSVALEGLMASGVLDDLTAGPDDIRIELERITAARSVEDELRRLKEKREAVGPARPEAGPGARSAESGGESSV